MPVFFTALLTQARRRPGVAFLGVLVLGGLLYWTLAPAIPVPPRPAPRPPAVQGLGIERAAAEKTWLDVQRENKELKLAQAEQQRAIRALEQSQAAKEEEAKRVAAAQQQQMEGLLKQAQLAVQQAQAKATPPKPAVAQKPVAPIAQAKVVAEAASPVPREAGVKVRILKTKEPASFQGVAPAVGRADGPYLPAGSIAEGRVVTGIMASAKTNGIGGVMLFTVTKPFQSPYQLHGPDRDSTPTAVPIQGCLIFGKAQADLGSGRVIGQLTLLSCVFPDLSTFEQPIHGYVVDADQTLGLVGELQTHTSAVMTKAFLTALLQEASAAFGLARSQLVVTQGGGIQTGQGTQTALAEISRFYLEQARELAPTLWVQSMRPARLVLLEGTTLEGFPTHVLLAEPPHS